MDQLTLVSPSSNRQSPLPLVLQLQRGCMKCVGGGRVFESPSSSIDPLEYLKLGFYSDGDEGGYELYSILFH